MAAVTSVKRFLYVFTTCKVEVANFTWSTSDTYVSLLANPLFAFWFPNVSADTNGPGYSLSGKTFTLTNPTAQTAKTDSTLIIIGT